jgi:preprotein translocase subunit SecD
MKTRFPNHIAFSIAATGVLVLSAALLLPRALSSATEPEKPKGGKQETVLLFEPVEKGDVSEAKLTVALDRRLNPGGLLSWFKRVKIEVVEGGRIQVTVPSTDPNEIARIQRKVLSVGTLEFRILATDQRADFKTYIERAKALPNDQRELRDAKTGEEPAKLLAWWVSVAEGREAEFRNAHFGTREITDAKGGKHLEVLVVKDPWDVTGEYLIRANPGVNNAGRPCVNFMFNTAGAAKFGRLTGDYIPDTVQQIWYHMGIILDKKLCIAPRIHTPIHERGEISGGFTLEKVKELADTLDAGALPVALRRVSP